MPGGGGACATVGGVGEIASAAAVDWSGVWSMFLVNLAFAFGADERTESVEGVGVEATKSECRVLLSVKPSADLTKDMSPVPVPVAARVWLVLSHGAGPGRPTQPARANSWCLELVGSTAASAPAAAFRPNRPARRPDNDDKHRCRDLGPSSCNPLLLERRSPSPSGLPVRGWLVLASPRVRGLSFLMPLPPALPKLPAAPRRAGEEEREAVLEVVDGT